MTDEITTLYVKRIVLAGVLLAAVLIAAVFITGQTFGQRCSKRFEYGTPSWSECVDRLKRGGDL